MGSEWTKCSLSNIANIQTGPFGSQLHNEDYVLFGTPIVTVEHLGKRRFSTQNLPRVSEQDKNRLSKYILKLGDIVFSRVGSVDRCSFVSKEYEGWMFSGRCLRVRPETNRVYAEFLYYALNQESTKQQIRNIAVGATMPSINTSLLGEVTIDLPTYAAQRSISATISCLDDKIELNNRIIANLEAQTQAIFDEWLMAVDVDFPAGVLSDIADVNPTRSLSKGQLATYIEMSNLSTSNSFPNNWVENTPFNGGMKFKNGDTLIARITPCLENGKTAYISCLEDGEVGFGSTEYVVLSAKPGYCDEMLYFLARNEEFRNYAIQNMNGSSGRQRVSGETIGNYEMAVPTKEASKQFEAFAKPIMEMIRNCAMQNRELAQTRDALLPKLMSGEIEVSVEG